MGRAEILALYDEEMRRRPPSSPGTRVEDLGKIVRIVGEYHCIIYSDLGPTDALRVVADQTAFFRSIGAEVEWKLFGHDQPPELGELLRQAGYVPDPTETLVVYDLAEPLATAGDAEDLEIRPVRDEEGLRLAVAVSEGAFGPGEGWKGVDYRRYLGDAGFAAYVAYRAGVPVAAGRLEMPPGRSFASLWGGGTIPGHRGQGIYQRLVAVRAELAKSRGYRYLTVDARETSRPILTRLGFSPLDTITGWNLRAASPTTSSREDTDYRRRANGGRPRGPLRGLAIRPWVRALPRALVGARAQSWAAAPPVVTAGAPRDPARLPAPACAGPRSLPGAGTRRRVRGRPSLAAQDSRLRSARPGCR